MEATLAHTSSNHFCSSLHKPITKTPQMLLKTIHSHHACLPARGGHWGGTPLRLTHQRSLVECAKRGPVKVPELGEEDMDSEEEWEGIGGRWMEKCKGEGIVELMECLEREAIMGEDEGREATDYHRRARIFAKSSTVFQALKQHNTTPP